MAMSARPDLTAIRAAHERIRPFIHRTPVLTCTSIDALAGCRVYFKCENFQKVGAFKIRGAMNAVLSLSNSAAACGVATTLRATMPRPWHSLPGSGESQRTL